MSLGDDAAAERADHLDARLVPSVVLCWGVTAAGLCFGWQPAVGICAVLVVLGLSATIRAVRGQGVCRHAAGAAAAMLLAAGFAGAIAVRGYALAQHPLSRLHTGARVIVSVTLVDDPKPLAGRVFGSDPMVVAHARLQEMRYGGSGMRVGGDVVVRAPARGWIGLLPGQRLTVPVVVARPFGHELAVALVCARTAPRLLGQPPWWQRAAGRIRRRFARSASLALPHREAGLLPALVIGDTTAESSDVIAQFKDAGISHLTAVSGDNLAVLTSCVGSLGRRATLSPRWRIVAMAAAIIGFTVVARPSPSMLRAAVMGMVAVAGMATGRGKQALPALCGATVVLLAVYPMFATDIGFILSVAATAGLIVWAPTWQHRLLDRGWRKLPAEIVAVATAAFLATAPAVVAVSGTVSPVPIISNIAIHVVAPWIMMLGLVAVVGALLWIPLGAALTWPIHVLLWWLLSVARWSAALSGLSLSLPAGVAGAGLLTLVGVAAWWLFGQLRGRWGRAVRQ